MGHLILLENAPQDLKDTVKCLFQVHKTVGDLLSKLPCTLRDPTEGIELVHTFTSMMKTA